MKQPKKAEERLEKERQAAYKKLYGGLRAIPFGSLGVCLHMVLEPYKRFKSHSKKWACDKNPHRDHVQGFRTKSGEIIYTSQPYCGDRNSFETIKQDVESFAAEHGLAVRASIDESWHYPGRTVLIEYRKK